MAGNVARVVRLEPDQQRQLEAFANARSLPHAQVLRAKILLLAAEGRTNKAIAAELGVTRETVGKWRSRFLERGIEGLYDELRPGKPRTITDEQVAEVIQATLNRTPKGQTHWSVRTMAEETGISKSTVHRVWQAFGLKPHRQESFKLSTDPFFVEKVIDITGLYLNPPDHAVVLSVDEKSQCQALERSQPILPMGLGYVEGVTHDYVRHGTTTLFAALDIANGAVLAACKARHRHQEFLSFLRTIDENVPEELDVHLILDNYATHKHEKVRGWLARNPRFHTHFTPTYSSWLNQVERWFAIVTDRAIRRGSFASVGQLKRKIMSFVDTYNETATPFRWTATADSIFEKLQRLCGRITGTGH
jgi:putative transposase